MADRQLPINPAINAVPPKHAPENEGNEIPSAPPIPVPEAVPPHASQKQTTTCRPDQTPWWKNALEVIAVFVGICVAIIYWRQLNVMQGTLDELKRSGEQSTEQMWSAIGNINWEARSMDLSQQQAQKSLQATLDNFQIEQRAWVELDPPKGVLSPPSYAPPGVPNPTLFRFPMYLRNVGRTSAFDIKVRWATPIESAIFADDKAAIGRLQLPIEVLRKNEIMNVRKAFGPKTKVGTYEGFVVPGVLAPGVRSNAPFIMLAITPTEARKGRSPPDSLNYFTYLIGRAEYSDTFGAPHWMTFCYYVWTDVSVSFWPSGK